MLERQGFIRLLRGEDKRERIVALTRAGRAAISRGYPVWKQAQSAIAVALEPKELDAQLRSLRRLTEDGAVHRVRGRGRSGRPEKDRSKGRCDRRLRRERLRGLAQRGALAMPL